MSKIDNQLKVLFVALFCLCLACTSKPEEAESILIKDSLGVPNEIADSININYTVSAIRRLNLKAPLMQRYPTKNNDNVLFMRKGLEVYFYDEEGKLKTTIKSEWAKRFEKTKKTELHNHVVVTNDRQESMATEEIFWDELQKKIFTTKFVTITTPTEILTGYGLEAADDFSSYEIKNPKGIIKRNDIK
jgi:LPS export ABC transporter protein LptC